MSGNVGDMATRGALPGLLINPDAARYALRGRPQLRIANTLDLSPGYLSDVMKGRKGCKRETAERLAEALEMPVGVLFPELADFTVEVRRFVASRVVEAAA